MKKENKVWLVKFFGSLLFIFMTFNLTSGLIINIETPPEFGLGEQVYFNYTFSSERGLQISYYSYVDCPSAPLSFRTQKIITLNKNEIYEDSTTEFLVEGWFESQTCTAYVQVLSPIQKTVSKNFTIVTDPSFEFDLKLDKKVFILNEAVNIDYDSDVSDLTISAELVYPDGKSESVDLPATIGAEEIGTYDLEISVSKEGYKTLELKEQFAVIEGDADIVDVVVVDFDEGDVDFRADKKGKGFFSGDYVYLIVIGFIILLLLIILFVIYFLKKRQQM